MSDTALIQSVLRGLDILGVVAQRPEGLRLSEVADQLGLKAPTAHKLIRTLVSRGFVERSRRPIRYRLGPAMLELAARHWHSHLLLRAPTIMRGLRIAFPPGTATLCEHLGGEVMVMLRMSPERPDFVERPTHRVMSPYSSASALAFQAFWSADDRAAYRQRYPFWEHAAHLWQRPEDLDAFLSDVRTRGLAAPEFSGRNAYPCAAPIFDTKGILQGTIGLSVPGEAADADTRTRIQGELARAARELASCARGPVSKGEDQC